MEEAILKDFQSGVKIKELKEKYHVGNDYVFRVIAKASSEGRVLSRPEPVPPASTLKPVEPVKPTKPVEPVKPVENISVEKIQEIIKRSKFTLSNKEIRERYLK